jgi:hypothetical protein
MEEPPGPPVIHSSKGSSEGLFCDSKYQKKRCLEPTSSQPVYCFERASHKVEFCCCLMRMEWSGENWDWWMLKPETSGVSWNGIWEDAVAVEHAASREATASFMVGNAKVA